MSDPMSGAGMDALRLLGADHAAIGRLFMATADACTDDARAGLASRLCRALAVHAAIEEELLYPAASEVLSDVGIVRRAEVEHAAVKEIVRRVESLAPSDPRFRSSLAVLAEHVQHHAHEEEQSLFPRLRRSPLDLVQLGSTLRCRREAIARRFGGAAESLESDDAGGVRHGAHRRAPLAARVQPRDRVLLRLGEPGRVGCLPPDAAAPRRMRP
jgi:hemerythrin superfamily protein